MDKLELNTFYDAFIYLLIGAIMIIVFFIYSKSKKRVIKKGVKVEGIVFDFIVSGSVSIRSRYPVIRFLTEDNVWVTEPYNIAIPFSFKKGQRVEVIYNPENPKEFILNSGEVTKYISILILLLGIASFVLGIYKVVLAI